ncbi:MAG TPA: hypothetical protein VJX74_00465 [Blastocatellia bacterium]|nr:hypothetical protein [Blastocatellia bacterium]
MTVLCDFTLIQGDGSITIGDGLPVWEKKFNTGGRRSDAPALLIFNVKGLTRSTSSVNVKINNLVVGQIHPYSDLTIAARDDNAKNWFTQMIAMNGTELKDGDNEIQIEAVGFPESTSTNKFDDFQLKDVVCFFHQAA